MKKKDEIKEAGKQGKPSEVKVRMKIQEVLQKNMRTPLGMFHGKELNERGFVNDLFKNFDITPKNI